MADNNDPPTPLKTRGRPKGKKYAENRYDAKRNYSYSITECARNRCDPNLFFDWHFMIASGKTPRVILDASYNPIGIEEDPSPNAAPPTLAQRSDSVRVVAERRDGLAPQKIDFNANIQNMLPENVIKGFSPQALVLIAQALGLADPNVIDVSSTDIEQTEPEENAIEIIVPE